MKKTALILLLCGLLCIAAIYSVIHTDKPIPVSGLVSEQLGLQPIDPRPVVMAFGNPEVASVDAKNIVEAKDWQFENAEWSEETGMMLMHTPGSAWSASIPIPPGVYLFQFDQRAVPVPHNYRLQVTAGTTFSNYRYDTNCTPERKHYWLTLSHIFRVGESENQIRLFIQTTGYMDRHQGPSVEIRNIKIIPVQALLNLAPKGQPLRDIYWGKNAVSRTEPTGMFLPLGREERIQWNDETKRSTYQFGLEREVLAWRSYIPWEVPDPTADARARNVDKTFPPVSIEVRSADDFFELRPVFIGTNGKFHLFPSLLVVPWINHRDGDRPRFQSELNVNYSDFGQTSYFRVVPGEAMDDGMQIWPLYTARNQVYFLFRNDSNEAQLPKFSARLTYQYSEQAEPKEVLFQASGNTIQAFDDIACHWEILGKEDIVRPGEERIGVFTLETSKLRSSAHAHHGSFVSDVFSVEFDLGLYKLLNEQMRFFPPRLAIE